MKVADAKATLLMGQPGSWNGNAKKPLYQVPTPVLRQARNFFTQVKREGSTSPKVDELLEAIPIVLDDREAHSPQVRMAL